MLGACVQLETAMYDARAITFDFHVNGIAMPNFKQIENNKLCS
ncbi:MAG: RAxF-45 family protein [Kurthia sp.]